jgi:cell division protein FtsW
LLSYGGSSLVSLALGIGFLIAVMRKRPRSMILAGVRQQEDAA